MQRLRCNMQQMRFNGWIVLCPAPHPRHLFQCGLIPYRAVGESNRFHAGAGSLVPVLEEDAVAGGVGQYQALAVAGGGDGAGRGAGERGGRCRRCPGR